MNKKIYTFLLLFVMVSCHNAYDKCNCMMVSQTENDFFDKFDFTVTNSPTRIFINKFNKVNLFENQIAYEVQFCNWVNNSPDEKICRIDGYLISKTDNIFLLEKDSCTCSPLFIFCDRDTAYQSKINGVVFKITLEQSFIPQVNFGRVYKFRFENFSPTRGDVVMLVSRKKGILGAYYSELIEVKKHEFENICFPIGEIFLDQLKMKILNTSFCRLG